MASICKTSKLRLNAIKLPIDDDISNPIPGYRGVKTITTHHGPRSCDHKVLFFIALLKVAIGS